MNLILVCVVSIWTSSKKKTKYLLTLQQRDEMLYRGSVEGKKELAGYQTHMHVSFTKYGQ